VFSALLLLMAVGPLPALVIASGFAAGAPYAGCRFFAFGAHRSR
jgi:hypothetical protein